MTNPVRHCGAYLSVTLSAVLSSDGIITIYSIYVPGYSLREILRRDQVIFIIFQGFAMSVLHSHCKAPGRYDKGLVSCRRSGWENVTLDVCH